MKALRLVHTGTKGSHEQYEGIIGGKTRKVTVDTGKAPFDKWHLKNMIRQAGVSRNEFYSASKVAARKI